MATKTKTAATDNGQGTDKGAAHLEALETRPSVVKPITLPPLDIRWLKVKIVGDSPLICHRWSEKARKAMIDKQTGTPTAGREYKVPEEDYQSSLYPHPDGGYGFPAIAFKNAAVTACTSLGKAITKVGARQAFHVVGELVKIEGEPQPREDMVRIGMGTADIRYRGEFPVWSCVLTIRFNARVLTHEQIVNMLNTAGFPVGVGEWRAEKDGSNGLFHCE